MYPSKEDVENHKTPRWMKYLFAGALALLAYLGANLAFAAEICPQGIQTLTEITAKAEEFVKDGKVEEALVLKGASLVNYVNHLNEKRGMAVPANKLTELVVVVRLDGSAAIFGFVNGCMDGSAILAIGTHQAAVIDTGGPDI